APSPSRKRLLGRLDRSGNVVRAVAAGLSHRRLAAAATADELSHLRSELSSVDPECLIEVDDDVDSPFRDRRDDRTFRLLLLPDPVGEIAERAWLEVARAREHDAVDAIAHFVIGRRLGLWPLRLFPHPLELAAQRICLACPFVQERERFAGRYRLDPPSAGADRALGDDRERPNLGRR